MVHPVSDSHPYFPLDLHLPDYVPLQVGFDYILGVFAVAVITVFASTWRLSGRHKHLRRSERLMACWFMVTGLIHFVVEGWVVYKADFYQDKSGNYLSDTWKEYSKADSRYASRDSFIISMEAITAFLWGPLCPLLVWGIFNAKPWRYTLMLIVSVGQIYGDVLYFGTCYLEGFVHSRPEPMYFWFYFVVVNAIWIVVPLACVAHAWRAISAAVGSGKPKAKRK
ncbi:sterol 8,7-isomerase [Micractinium conductrix]|uniref:Sterol 8,7-isomerase n=1 Tax=Micractinium conductrix TaxID=554055 RepID=A0A2P6V6S4_9CHLO|nr:sterol 8,7-isomerase [Micractinium conductrix]|eukprot:PSC69778.1 sterol 8,7-isomerase [Micractinium conductrix]